MSRENKFKIELQMLNGEQLGADIVIIKLRSAQLAKQLKFVSEHKQKKWYIHVEKQIGFNETNLSCLADISFVRRLQIDGTVKNCGGIESLADLAELRLVGEPIRSIDISKNKKLKSLFGIYPKDASFDISSLDKIEELRLWKVKKEDLSFLGNQFKLKKLHIFQSEIKTVNGLSSKVLEKIHLGINRQLVDIDQLRKLLERLAVFIVERCPKLIDFAPLSSAGSLARFEAQSQKISTLEWVRYLPITEFVTRNEDIVDGNIEPLLDCRNLKLCIYTQRQRYNLSDAEFLQRYRVKHKLDRE
jgi:hypothetical protein